MIVTTALAIVLTFGQATGVASPPAQDPRANVETAVAQAIRLLEAKDYPAFLRTFVPPDALKELSAAESFDGFVKTFVDDGKAAALLAALKDVRGTKPVVENDGRRATFTLRVPVERKTTLAWVKIDGLWYISDN